MKKKLSTNGVVQQSPGEACDLSAELATQPQILPRTYSDLEPVVACLPWPGGQRFEAGPYEDVAGLVELV